MDKRHVLVADLGDEFDIGESVAEKVGLKIDGISITKDANGRLFAQVPLSPDEGNLLTLRANGLFYSSQTSVAYYVNKITGNDADDGSPDSPLATVAEAVLRLPPNSAGGYVYLAENQDHYIVSSRRVITTASVTLMPYGPQTELAKTAWGDCPWPWTASFNAPMATLLAFADDVSPSEPGRVLAGNMGPLGGATFTYFGLQLETCRQSNLSDAPEWRSSFTTEGGDGTSRFYDCNLLLYKGSLVCLAAHENIIIKGCTASDNGGGGAVYFDASGASGASLKILQSPSGSCNGQPWRTGYPASYFSGISNGLVNAGERQLNYAGLSTNLP